MNLPIRKISAEDINDLKAVVDTSGLFPSEMLDDMLANYWQDSASSEIWLTQTEHEKPVSIAFCAPEKMTEGTYNLYLIAVHKTHQGKGLGKAMMTYLEDLLRKQGQRILIVETSGLPDFELTRKFYHQCQYTQEAVIRDFYQEGEDKVIFWKKLKEEQ